MRAVAEDISLPWSVCLSVCVDHNCEPCETAELLEEEQTVDRVSHVLDGRHLANIIEQSMCNSLM